MFITSFFLSKNLDPSQKFVYLHCVFIVLDLRLTKDWLSGKIAFFILFLLAPPKKSVTTKNETK